MTVVSPKSLRQIFVVGLLGTPGGFIGSSPAAQKQPAQMGREPSPASNSIQTPAPIGGTEKKPEVGPA